MTDAALHFRRYADQSKELRFCGNSSDKLTCYLQKSTENRFAMGFLHFWIMFLRSLQQGAKTCLNCYIL